MANPDQEKPEIRYGLTEHDIPGHTAFDIEKLPPAQRTIVEWFVDADPADTSAATQGIVERRREQNRELDQ